MTTTPSESREADWKELESFLGFFTTHVHGILPDDPVHPSNTIKDIVARFGRAKAFSGLRQAINDVIEETRPWRPERVGTFSAECAARGFVTLSELRRRYSGRYKSIVKRGRIRSETEYCLVMGVLAGPSQGGVQERQQLDKMVLVYKSAQAGAPADGLRPTAS